VYRHQNTRSEVVIRWKLTIDESLHSHQQQGLYVVDSTHVLIQHIVSRPFSVIITEPPQMILLAVLK